MFCFLVRAVQVIIPWHLKRCDSNRKALRFESRFWARSVGDSSGWKSVDRQRKYILDRSTLDRTVRSKSRAFGGAIEIARGRWRDSNRERAAVSRFKSRAGGGVAIQIASGRRRDSNRERTHFKCLFNKLHSAANRSLSKRRFQDNKRTLLSRLPAMGTLHLRAVNLHQPKSVS